MWSCQQDKMGTRQGEFWIQWTEIGHYVNRSDTVIKTGKDYDTINKIWSLFDMMGTKKGELRIPWTKKAPVSKTRWKHFQILLTMTRQGVFIILYTRMGHYVTLSA